MDSRLSHLRQLEAEAIYIIREAYAQFNYPCILFSGGKDSIVLTHLAIKAFLPARIPFPLVHIDTGHNFYETLEFRDKLVKKIGARLVTGFVQHSIDKGSVKEEKGINASRNTAQIVTLLETIEANRFDAAMGGARRDEEKARAKERFFSHRDLSGQWDPKNQRPELWNILNGRKNYREHFRVFPISNWTELDIWQYIQEEGIELPSLYFSHERKCVRKGNSILAYSPYISLSASEKVEILKVRFRTIGDMTISGAIESNASTVDEVIAEILQSRFAERGTREDDLRSETAMEERKKEGYF